MRPLERVAGTIKGLPVDRVPLGELTIDAGFICSVMQKDCITFTTALQFWELLQLDLVVLASPEGQMPGAALGGENFHEQIKRWRQQTDYYVFALFNGGFSRAFAKSGFKEFMQAVLQERATLQKRISKFTSEMINEAEEAITAGAHGIIIADDIAYQRGTYLSPVHMQELYFSALADEINKLKKDAAVFFHSDGNLHKVLPGLVAVGFDGLQGLEPAAGMELKAVKSTWGSEVCLMGNIDPTLLSSTAAEQELRETVISTVQTGKEGGRYIFGTCGGLYHGLNVDKVLSMYRYAQEAGEY